MTALGVDSNLTWRSPMPKPRKPILSQPCKRGYRYGDPAECERCKLRGCECPCGHPSWK